MLRVYLDNIFKDCDLIRDVEKQFSQLKLKCIDKEKELVEKIEQGKLLNSASFIDRFGYKLYLSELSTGCKAALCVLNCKDKIIDLVECGFNARDTIIKTCDDGAVLIDSNSITIANADENKSINVRVDNYIFTNVDRLNEYIFYEYPFKPNLDTEGIKELGEELV